MLLEILRFTRGSVSFFVSGRYPERFLNITSRNNIRLWDVRRTDEGFTACMYRADYRKIRNTARGAGVRLRIINKRGLPEYLTRYRDRAGIVIGGCAFILAVFVMSLFVWSVEITGLDTVSETQMRSDLREHGLYVGAFKPSLDCTRIARDILIERHEIGWMAVNLSGSYACVEIKEEAPAPQVEDVHTPCNVKAECDGQIIRIEASDGETVIKEGSGVIEGQLVVSGVMGEEQGAYRLVHADARVIARTKREASFTVSENQRSLRPDGDIAYRKLFDFLGAKLPCRFGAVNSPFYAAQEESEVLSPLGISLPVGMTEQTVCAFEYTEMTLDNNSAKEILTRESQLYEAFFLTGCKVEKRDMRMSRSDGAYTLNAIYTCVEDIAYKEPIGTDENTGLTRYIVPTEKPDA